MNIDRLSQKLQIPTLKLRHILKQKLVPLRTPEPGESLAKPPDEIGVIAAILLGCAAYLEDAGYLEQRIGGLINAICCSIQTSHEPHTHAQALAIGLALSSPGCVRVQFADGRYVRWIFDQTITEWIDSKSITAATAGGYVANVIVEIDLGAIRTIICR